MVQNLLLSGKRQLLLDTNAFIYFLTGQEPHLSILLPLFRRVQAGEVSVIVSVITEAELRVRPERQGALDVLERISDLLSENGIYVIGVDRRIARRAAALRANNDFGLPDAIIMATAIETGCDAVVGNDYKWRKLTDIPFVCLDDLVASS